MAEFGVAEFDLLMPGMGFIYLSDGLRVGYAVGVKGVDEDGLFLAKQAYGELRVPGARHMEAARAFIQAMTAVDATPHN